MKNIFAVIILATLLAGLRAQPQPTLTMGHRINVAARQRMLSQHMAKDYVFLWRKINETESAAELAKAIETFDNTLVLLHNNPLSPEVQYRLTDVHTVWSVYKKMLATPLQPAGVKPFLAQSNAVLLASEALLKEIEKYARAQPNFNADAKIDSRRSIVNVMCRQCMLSQRIATYYAVLEVNPNDEELKGQLTLSIKQMEDEWGLIQTFVATDPSGFSKITSTPEFAALVVQRKAYSDLLITISQNKRVDTAALGSVSNKFVNIMGDIVYATEEFIGM